jgi:hypothetical protein
VSYIDDSLIEGEKILHRARISWWSQFGWVLLGIILLAAFGLGLLFLGWAWIQVRSTEIAITSLRVIAKFGFIKRDTVEINLEKVEALKVEQGFVGRMLNYGTILISGAGTSVAPMRDIADPLVFRRSSWRRPTGRSRAVTLRSLLVDFNSYFASVEQQVEPRLRGDPSAWSRCSPTTTVCIARAWRRRPSG